MEKYLFFSATKVMLRFLYSLCCVKCIIEKRLLAFACFWLQRGLQNISEESVIVHLTSKTIYSGS